VEVGVGASIGVSTIGGVATGDGDTDTGGSGFGFGGVDGDGDGVGFGVEGGDLGGEFEEELPQFLLQSTGRVTTGEHVLVDF